MSMHNSLILDPPIEYFPSSATITQGSPSFTQTTPRSPTVSRLVSFSTELLGSPFEPGTPGQGQGSRIFRASSPTASISSSMIHQQDAGLASGSGFAGRASPSPQSRSRSLSRISQSGSMANLMNLITSKSRSRASRGDGGGIDSPSMSVEGFTTGGGWFGKACSSFIRPWYGGDGAEGEAEDGSASEEGKKAFGETKQVCWLAVQNKTRRTYSHD
jgi:hypothetical protein